MKLKPIILEYPEFSNMEIACVGDFHIGDNNHIPSVLKDIQNWVHEKDNRFIIIAGDVFNAALASSISDVYTEQYTVDEAMEVFGKFIDDLGSERILVCIDGNHDQRVWKSAGIDPVKYVCKTHGVRYCPGEAYLTIKIGTYYDRNGKAKNSMVNYRIYVTHGVGGGRSAGGKLNNVMRLGEIVVADIYIQGHQHDPVVKPKVIYEWSPQNNSIVERQQLYIVTGACLERGGYAVNKAYAPVSMAIPIVTLDGTCKHINATL